MSSYPSPSAILRLTMAKPITRGQIKEAVQKGAAKWLADHKGNQSLAARVAAAEGKPISQQNLSWAARGLKIGEKMAFEVALLHDTTPDGLVGMFLGGIEETALKHVQGWAKAKGAAREELGPKVEPWVWAAIDHVIVPARLRPATTEMVIQIATFLDRWGSVSGVRARVALSP